MGGEGGVSSKQTMLDMGGGVKKSVFGGTSFMDGP